MSRTWLVSLVASASALVAPAVAAAEPLPRGADYRPGEVIVDYTAGATRTLKTRDGESVSAALARLRRHPRVERALPNFIAHASAFQPNDPGFPFQWNMAGPFGIGMPDAWEIARGQGAPGGQGVVVAVLDTGVAYRTLGNYRRAPDLRTFAPGYDFVARDRLPLDRNGHGTHVAGTIAGSTNNGTGAAGIAYRARIMPVRVLDARGDGDVATIARGIRFAARQGADVLNLSFEFPPSVRASDIPAVVSALRYARRRGSVVVASAGNDEQPVVAYPARVKQVIAVGATTERGCQAVYSNGGPDLDVVAPGGGSDAAGADGPAGPGGCQPGAPGRSIYQQTFTVDARHFGMPGGYSGTSFAAPHVSGTAALIIASGRRAGTRPSALAVERRIKLTARDLGPEGYDTRYGHGLIDAAAALR